MRFLLITILLISTYGTAEEERKWIDPNDPTLEHKPRILTNTGLQQCTQLPQQPDQTLRLILRQIMRELHVDYNEAHPVRRDVQIKISKYAMTTISKYLNEDNEADSPELRENIRSSLANIFTVLEASPEPTWMDTLAQLQPLVYIMNLIILPAAFIIIIRTVLRPRHFWSMIISIIILVSVYSGYSKKYQELEAKRFAQYQQNTMNEACASEGIVSRIFDIVASTVQYRQKSNCLKYIESQTVSIIHEISLIEVVSETVINGFFALFSPAGKHINHFFRDLYDGVPILAQIVSTIFIVLMSGAIRTPFFSYDPILLTFASNAFGRIAGWLEGPEDVQNLRIEPTQKVDVPRIEAVKKSGAGDTMEIEYVKSEDENGKKEKEVEVRKVEKKVSDEASEDEEEEDDQKEEDKNNSAKNTSLSDTSF